MFRERDLKVALLVAYALTFLYARPSHAQFTATETNDVSVVHLQPTQTFIVPHVGRSFQNALAFHQKLFDFKPREKMTVLLTDFSDAGNASAEAVPRDFVTLAHRATELRLRDVHGERAHVVPDESRAGARDDQRSSGAARSLLPPAVSRQGRSRRRTS